MPKWVAKGAARQPFHHANEPGVVQSLSWFTGPIEKAPAILRIVAYWQLAAQKKTEECFVSDGETGSTVECEAEPCSR